MKSKYHSDEQCVIKLKALINECKYIYSINMKNKGMAPDAIQHGLYNLNHRIDSMNQLAMELEREFL